MILSAVAAMAKNRVIGVNNTLPWHLPEDLQFFKDKTKGKIMIMGRKTFESLPKPLPGRYHLVITRQTNYKVDHPMVEILGSLPEAIARAKAMIPHWPEEVCIVGGGEIYKESLPVLHRIYLTVIEKDFEGDAKFPEFDESVFKLKSREERTEPMRYSFRLYERS
jgi:dihydrofolate reductase